MWPRKRTDKEIEAMFRDKKYYRTYSWKGTVYRKECKDHSFAYSGSIPCTGIYRCIHCGFAPKEDHMGRKQ